MSTLSAAEAFERYGATTQVLELSRDSKNSVRCYSSLIPLVRKGAS